MLQRQVGHRSLAAFLGRALLAMKDDEHKLNRGMMNPSFLPGKARSYVEGIIEPTCHS